MSLVDFLNGTGPDHQGRYLRDIWDFDDKAIEQTHDFIQWMFPLTEKSMSVPGVPTLSAEDVEAIRTSDVARSNLEKSALWYLGFLQRNGHWIQQLKVVIIKKSHDDFAVLFDEYLLKCLGS